VSVYPVCGWSVFDLKAILLHFCLADPVKVCSELLIRTRGNCSSQTESTARVRRQGHHGRLIVVANEQYCSNSVYRSVHITKVLRTSAARTVEHHQRNFEGAVISAASEECS